MVRSPGRPRRRLHLHWRLIIASALILSALPGSAGRASATQEDTDGLYESPNYGYAVMWDATVWQKTAETSEGGVDYVRVEDGRSTVHFSAYADGRGNAAVCFGDQTQRWARVAGLTRMELVLNDPIAYGTVYYGDEIHAYARFDVTIVQDGISYDYSLYLECRRLVPGESVIELAAVTNKADDSEDERVLVSALLDGIDTLGGLRIEMRDANGDPLPGGCYDISAEDPVGDIGSYCDGDDGKEDGQLRFTKLPSGSVIIAETQPPDGYDPFWSGFVDIRPRQEAVQTFRYVTGPDHPYVIPRGLCLPDTNGDPADGVKYWDRNGKEVATFDVTDLSLNYDIGNLRARPAPGQRYVFVAFTVANTGTSRLQINRDDFVLLDQNGFLYAPYSSATDFLQDATPLDTATIAAGKQFDGGLVFSVPEDSARPDRLLYRPSPDRMFPLLTFQWENRSDEQLFCP